MRRVNGGGDMELWQYEHAISGGDEKGKIDNLNFFIQFF